MSRRLHDVGIPTSVADPRRVDSYLKIDVGPATCVIVEDNGRHSLRRSLRAILDTGATLVYVLAVGGQLRSPASFVPEIKGSSVFIDPYK